MIKDFNIYLGGIDYEFWIELCKKHGSVRIIPRGKEFITAGKVAKNIGYITKGSVKYIVLTSDAREKVIGLESAGGFAASFPFCFNDIPSLVSVVSTSDVELYSIPVKRIKELAEDDSHIRFLLSKTLEVVFYDIYSRYIGLYALSPKERYEQLARRCPTLFEVFAQKDIASYLNITPQHLRRLKNEISG